MYVFSSVKPLNSAQSRLDSTFTTSKNGVDTASITYTFREIESKGMKMLYYTKIYYMHKSIKCFIRHEFLTSKKKGLQLGRTPQRSEKRYESDGSHLFFYYAALFDKDKLVFVNLSKKRPCIPGSSYLYLLRSFHPAKNGSYGIILIG